jgi:hypothetical protein
MEKIQVTMQEIWMVTKPKIFKNKKKYNRKSIKKVKDGEFPVQK